MMILVRLAIKSLYFFLLLKEVAAFEQREQMVRKARKKPPKFKAECSPPGTGAEVTV